MKKSAYYDILTPALREILQLCPLVYPVQDALHQQKVVADVECELREVRQTRLAACWGAAREALEALELTQEVETTAEYFALLQGTGEKPERREIQERLRLHVLKLLDTAALRGFTPARGRVRRQFVHPG